MVFTETRVEVQMCTRLCFAAAELYRVVEERVQLRFTPSQSNTCVAIAFETAVVAVAGVFGVMVTDRAAGQDAHAAEQARMEVCVS